MMNKEKAYDEALENARKLKYDCQKELDKTDKNSQLADLLRAGISAVEMIFPQLTESDDEKFRKYILQCCKECIEANDKGLELSMSTTKKLLVYLEKENEQKHILKFKVGDKVHLEGDDVNILTITGIEEDRYITNCGPILFKAEDIWQIVEQESIPNTYGCLNCTKLEECEKGLTPCSGHRLKIVDQKSTDDKAFEEWIDAWFKEHKEKAYPQITMDEKEFKNFCRGIRNMYQQKSDWSEEDKRMFSRCIKSIECSKKFADSETYKTAKDVEINWLKDIFLNHKKFTEAVDKLWSNDWSEENEKI